MDKKLKAKWVKALRSGKYKQAYGTLYDKEMESFCCLGVLAVCRGRKPAELAGLCFGNAKQVIGDQAETVLVGMNDGQKVSFKKIADYIEKNL